MSDFKHIGNYFIVKNKKQTIQKGLDKMSEAVKDNKYMEIKDVFDALLNGKKLFTEDFPGDAISIVDNNLVVERKFKHRDKEEKFQVTFSFLSRIIKDD